MSRILTVFGAIALVFVLVVAVLAIRSMNLSSEAAKYAKGNLPYLLKDWRQDELLDRVAPECKSAFSQAELPEIYAIFTKLGNPTFIGDPVAEAKVFINTNGQRQISALVKTEVHFERGPGTVQLNLVKSDDRWWICGFNINSKVFLRSEAPAN